MKGKKKKKTKSKKKERVLDFSLNAWREELDLPDEEFSNEFLTYGYSRLVTAGIYNIDEFTTLYYYAMGIRKHFKKNKRMVLNQSVYNLCQQNKELNLRLPPLDDGVLYVETDWPEVETGSLQGVLFIEAKEIQLPTIYGGLLNSQVLASPIKEMKTPILAMAIENSLPTFVMSFDTFDGQIVLNNDALFFDVRMANEHRDNFDPKLAKKQFINVIITLNALVKIQNGEFEREVKVKKKYPKANLKTIGRKIKRKIKYRQPIKEETMLFSHISTEPPQTQDQENPTTKTTGSDQNQENKTFTYTPRNTSSHFKERWVSMEYAENVDPDDLLDIQPKTRELKNGPVTKDWALVKVWYEHTHKPELEPKTTLKKYSV